MNNKSKAVTAIVVLGLVDAVAIGLPILGLVLLYVVLSKPPWFRNLVNGIYKE